MLPDPDKGVILEWSGSIVSIPIGWALCDGTQGTPNLTDRFVVGAGDTYSKGDTGGSATGTHTETGGAHPHSIVGGSLINSGSDYETIVNISPIAFTTNPSDDRPPFYALAFIMKI